ncbi:MAG: hypothetical protein B6240_14660 [Desulfobacteraceae bacterium 4572_87]|nr:MAG: hypothetical protein B6240_14660 [Desulfobacteraceae bacterium 4572_87]
MATLWQPQPDKDILCIGCIFHTGNKKCSVFPSGIPIDIWEGKHDHQTPYPGDNGIQFEPTEDAET